MGFLTDIAASTRSRLAAAPPDRERLRAEAERAPAARSLADTLRGYAEEDGLAVIAEVKRASPSAGAIAPQADPVVQAMAYDVAGAAAISVLTEPEHFGGSIADLVAVRGAVLHPVLRKDFLVDPVQVLEARAAGADSVLLITSCLADDVLEAMLATARELGMEPLVETHSDEDLERALATDAEVIGVNARDLESLEVDVAAAWDRLGRIGPERVAVAESGIGTPAQARAARAAGAAAILVGEALMRADDPGALIGAMVRGGEDG
jgi:indole-3-glycerol phosphate synthase